MCILDFLRSLICKRKKRIVLLVDGPNMIRREFNINLYNIMKKVSKYGKIKKHYNAKQILVIYWMLLQKYQD